MKIDGEYKWVARDNNGLLYVYKTKPNKSRGGNYWTYMSTVKQIDKTAFPFVKWEDEEPTELCKAQLQASNSVPMTNVVNKPAHYIGNDGMEVEDVLANFIPRYTDGYEAHRAASAVEYILRSPLKKGTEDIDKAIFNLTQLLAYRERAENDAQAPFRDKGGKCMQEEEKLYKEEMERFINTLEADENERW